MQVVEAKDVGGGENGKGCSGEGKLAACQAQPANCKQCCKRREGKHVITAALVGAEVDEEGRVDVDEEDGGPGEQCYGGMRWDRWRFVAG